MTLIIKFTGYVLWCQLYSLGRYTTSWLIKAELKYQLEGTGIYGKTRNAQTLTRGCFYIQKEENATDTRNKIKTNPWLLRNKTN